MADYTWPSTLPDYVLSDSYTRTPSDNTIETEVEGGPVMKRRRFTAMVDTAAVSFHMTAAQIAAFRTFFSTTLMQGVSKFNFTDPEDGVVRDAQIVSGSVQIVPDGTESKVSFTLRVWM